MEKVDETRGQRFDIDAPELALGYLETEWGQGSGKGEGYFKPGEGMEQREKSAT